MSCRRESHRLEFTPVVVPERNYDHSFQCEVDLPVDWNGQRMPNMSI